MRLPAAGACGEKTWPFWVPTTEAETKESAFWEICLAEDLGDGLPKLRLDQSCERIVVFLQKII